MNDPGWRSPLVGRDPPKSELRGGPSKKCCGSESVEGNPETSQQIAPFFFPLSFLFFLTSAFLTEIDVKLLNLDAKNEWAASLSSLEQGKGHKNDVQVIIFHTEMRWG